MRSSTKVFFWNTIWSSLSRSATIVIGLVTNIILANMLSPFEFGQVGIIMFFVTVINVFTESGLGGAIVRKKEIFHEDYSTVFLFNIAISVFGFLVLLLTSGTVANYYKDSSLELLLNVSGVMILVNAFGVVQNAKIYREMKFKRNLYISTSSIFLSSLLGVYLAWVGYGVWALVIMNLAMVSIKTILLWIYEGGIGKLVFSTESFKGLYQYGVFTTLTSIFNTAFENIYQLLLGKHFSISQVGYFYQGKKIQSVPFSILNSLSLGVVFSQLSKFQEDKKAFQDKYLKIFSIFSIITGGFASIVFLLAKDGVILVLGKVWIESVVYIQILSIASFFQMHKVFCQNILKVYNRTEKIFTWEMISTSLQIGTIVLGIMMKSILILLSGLILSNLIAYLINSFFSWKLLGLKSGKEMVFVFKVAIASSGSVLISQLITRMNLNNISTMLLMAGVFVSLYMFILKVLGIFDLKSSLRFIKSFKS